VPKQKRSAGQAPTERADSGEENCRLKIYLALTESFLNP
jgi:hypothetical protein